MPLKPFYKKRGLFLFAAVFLTFLLPLSPAWGQAYTHEFSLATGLPSSLHQDGYDGTMDGSMTGRIFNDDLSIFPWDVQGFLVLDDHWEIGSSLSNYCFDGRLSLTTPDPNRYFYPKDNTRASFLSAALCGKFYFFGSGILRPYATAALGASLYRLSTPTTDFFGKPDGEEVEDEAALALVGGGGGLELVFLHWGDSTETSAFIQCQYDMAFGLQVNLEFAPVEYGLSLRY